MSSMWLCLVMLPWPRAAAASAEVPRVLCGRVLADARVLYCYEADDADAARKRTAPYSDYGTIPYLDFPLDESWLSYDVDAAAWRWLPSSQESQESQKLRESKELLQSRNSKKLQKSQESQDPQESRESRDLNELSSALGPASLRSKRVHGIVDECCHKACYVSELMNYC